jgi:hypothetical protein
MEIFGILLSIPVAVVASMVYSALLAKFVRRLGLMRHIIYGISVILICLFVIELALLVTLGAVRSRAVVGPVFYVVHVVLFFFGTPALANVLILGGRAPLVSRWYFAGAICTIFAVFLVLLQYSVSEALFGIDGTNGPYS